MWQKRNKKRIFKGSVTVFALLLMFILAVTTIGIISTAAIERKVSISTGNSTTAFQVAESGMERTLQYFKSNFDKKLSDVGSCAVGTGIVTYDSSNTIRFKDAGDPNDTPPIPVYINDCSAPISSVKIIKSIGTTKQETRAIEQDVFLGATKLLLHFNGWNNSKSFDDSSFYWGNRTITNPGNKVTSNDSDPEKLGIGVAKFDGTGYLSVPDSTDWSFGAGDFTVDFWANFNNIVGQQHFVTQFVDAQTFWTIYKDAAGGIYLIHRNSSGIIGIVSAPAGTLINNNIWYHIAAVRKGANAYIFLNGQQKAISSSYSTNDVGDLTAVLEIGKLGSQYLNGWMDEVRISKGVARWVGGANETTYFTPPTKEYWPD